MYVGYWGLRPERGSNHPSAANSQGPFATPLNWAANKAGSSCFDSVTIYNDGTTLVRGLTLELVSSPKFFSQVVLSFPAVGAASSVTLKVVPLEVDDAKLSQLSESVASTVTCRLLLDGQLVFEKLTTLRVLAANEWLRSIRNDLIASFILPNHARIMELVAEAADIQLASFGTRNLEGYQSGDQTRVTQQAHAVYSALQKRGISYIGVPPSFESDGQKVRFADSLSNAYAQQPLSPPQLVWVPSTGTPRPRDFRAGFRFAPTGSVDTSGSSRLT